MRKLEVLEHDGLFSSIEELDAPTFERLMRGITIGDITKEGFFGSFIKKVTRVASSINDVTDLNTTLNRNVLKAGVINGLLKNNTYTKIASGEFIVENNFKGNRVEYVKALKATYTQTLEVLSVIMPQLNDLLEESYASKVLTPVTTIDTKSMEGALHLYKSFVKSFFSGNGEVSSIGYCFDNNKEIEEYLIASRSYMAAPTRLATIVTANKKLSERLRLISESDMQADKRGLHALSDVIMSVATVHSNLGKLNYYMDANMQTARNLLLDLQILTKKK